jgi:hypothetical protein
MKKIRSLQESNLPEVLPLAAIVKLRTPSGVGSLESQETSGFHERWPPGTAISSSRQSEPDSEAWTTNAIRCGQAPVLAEQSTVRGLSTLRWAVWQAHAESRSGEDIFPGL